MEKTGETANLGVAEDDCVVFVSQVETHQAIRAFFRPGTRSPFHASGIGKAILAHLGADRVEAIVGRTGLQSFTEEHAVAPAPARRRSRRDQGARLVGRRRGALSGHALRGGGDLQRVRRAGRRHLDLRPDRSRDAGPAGGHRAAGARCGRGGHQDDRRGFAERLKRERGCYGQYRSARAGLGRGRPFLRCRRRAADR